MNFATGTITDTGSKAALKTDSGESIILAGCDVVEGRWIQLGFRPEHMMLAKVAKPASGHISIGAHITVIEPMGHETLLTSDAGFGEIVGKYNSEDRFKPGDVANFRIRADRLHYFDLATGPRI